MATPTTLFQLTDLFNMDNFNSKITSTNTYIDDMVTAAKEAGVKISTGSYVGTGTYGSANPCSLTFDFEPTLLWIYAYQNGADIYDTLSKETNFDWCNVIPVQVVSSDKYLYHNGLGYFSTTDNADRYGKKSTDGKTYYWYNTSSTERQFNISSFVYYYIAIG